MLRIPSNSKYLSYYFIVIVNWVIVLPNNNISSVNNMKKRQSRLSRTVLVKTKSKHVTNFDVDHYPTIKSLLETNNKCISEEKIDSFCLFFLKEKLSSCKKQWISTHLLYSSSSLLFKRVTQSMTPYFLFFFYFFIFYF